ncbi:MAG: hypothetical protein GPOALKHO_001469 [Sodalis sp.]|uniref:hypothetical protein n=1 Tax=Sodalis sp. (in: enterobacteria) TaxID=1898979 RepID=UPI003872EB32|nr:MAG: hypothetical protein GPOALKHO_001469 [Sodalis sp.]
MTSILAMRLPISATPPPLVRGALAVATDINDNMSDAQEAMGYGDVCRYGEERACEHSVARPVALRAP